MWRYYLAAWFVRRQHRPNPREVRETRVTVSTLKPRALQHKAYAALDYVGVLCDADRCRCNAAVMRVAVRGVLSVAPSGASGVPVPPVERKDRHRFDGDVDQ